MDGQNAIGVNLIVAIVDTLAVGEQALVSALMKVEYPPDPKSPQSEMVISQFVFGH